MNVNHLEAAMLLIEMEYQEMPDLKLTLGQARRLWDLPLDLCESALTALVERGFLVRTSDGWFLRRGATAGSMVAAHGTTM
jgi:hypothetical protein